ncbi:class I SAM-dependent methyltransferase [Eggerthella guodeyinii]|uniref:Class I SAM-dependent methyltransferase n=1 Tax=Eggerthella guodeyinii TaxID=2690837 RepID=A0A6L7IV14_9ACTN|nr:class I SAM-dependent methyltransferase [Eggerthella guodeyinii]QOS69397.1 class I SAM-dependent methyltransferase [Eggerthella guodeyinii]
MDKAFWERFASLYDLAMKTRGGAADEAAAWAAARVAPDARVLDAACGTGLFACALAPGAARVDACDYAPAMVERTRAKAARLGLANVSCSVEDACALSFADDAFDAAVAANVLHLLDRPEAALAELSRVTKADGLLILPNYVNAESDGAMRFQKLIGAAGFSPARSWTADGYRAFLEANGLVVEESRLFDARQPLLVAAARVVGRAARRG